MDNSQEGKSAEAAKKGAYDEFTREELVKKCKHLLMIAQKSKQAKTEATAENAELKKQLEEVQLQSVAQKKELSTLQEIVESLTEQKLNFATELESFMKSNNSLKSRIELLNEKHEEAVGNSKVKNDALQREIAELGARIETMEIENTSLKRQNGRLSDENESLLSQLEGLERQIGDSKLGEDQRVHLATPDEITSKDPGAENLKISQSEQIQKLQIESASLSDHVDHLTKSLQSKEDELATIFKKLADKDILYNKEKETKERLQQRLKSYREKLVRCAASTTQLKNSNLVLMKTVNDYAKSVPKWQNDIVNASKMLSDQLLAFESENAKLKEDLRAAANDTHTEKISELNARNKQLERDLKTVREDNESVAKKIKNLEASNETFLNKVKDLESDKIALAEQLMLKEHEMRRVSEDSYNFKRMIEQLENEKGALERNIRHRKEDKTNEEAIVNLRKELSKAREAYRVLENEHKSVMDTNELLRDENNMLKVSHEAPNHEAGSLLEMNESLQADISKLETKLSSYKQENSSLLSDVKELTQKLTSVESIVKEAEEEKLRYSNYKIENTELLNEMKEVNQVLKERGETISKQEKAISESERVLHLLENEVKMLKETMADLEATNVDLAEQLDSEKKSFEELKKEKDEWNSQMAALKSERDSNFDEKEDTIGALRDEVEKLKHSYVYNDVQSEVMSTSTISKMDESMRLKELDDSFEERYNKLRTFAVKLKKKVETLQSSLQNVEEEKTLLEHNHNDLKNQLKAVMDTKSKETEECAGNENQMQLLKLENDTVNKKNDKLEEDLKTLVKEKVDLEVELGEFRKPKPESTGPDVHQVEINKLRADLELRSAELTSTREQLEKARKDAKKKSVLSLEMADYERSMKEQGFKLEENKKKMAQMESTIDTHQATITSLKTQLKLLEEQVKIEEMQTRQVKDSLHKSSLSMEERDGMISAKNDQISHLGQQVEELKSANEDLNIQLATSLGEKEKAVIALSNEKNELLQRTKKMEARLSELEEKCHLKNNEYDSLIAEFNVYKMRAQSVLRQNQVKDHSQEETLQNENATLKSEAESLKTKLEILKEECTNLASNLALEKRRTGESSTASAKLRLLSDQLSSELQSTRNELQEEKARFNLQVATLTQCYKKQISELEERLQNETAILKKELVSLENVSGRKTSIAHAASNSDGGSDSLDAEINVAMLQREEGEGSESSPPPFLHTSQSSGISGSANDGPVKSGRRSPLPLDRLLEEGVPDDLIGGENDLRFVNMSHEQQLAETKKRLETQEHRVQHVSLLLSESERESARLGEMCTVLKAEVRRLTRALDRHTHAHNPEYLKNVLFKFLTLSAGDERLRLVPVLNIILTLSPEETHKLDAVAKGVDVNANRGWGSYLPWPGPR